MAYKKIDLISQEDTLRQAKLFASGNVNVYLYCLTVVFNKLNEVIKEMNFRRTELMKMERDNTRLRNEVVKKMDLLAKAMGGDQS